MISVSEIQKIAPQSFKTELQERTYRALSDLGIDFERVDADGIGRTRIRINRFWVTPVGLSLSESDLRNFFDLNLTPYYCLFNVYLIY